MPTLSGRLGAALQAVWWHTPPNALANALRPLAALFAALAALHRALARPQRVGVPVVVVGNLIVGGAGKTPTTMAVVKLLRALGWQPGVVSRGHGRRSHGVLEVEPRSRAIECGDEPLLIRIRTGAPVMVGEDRVAAARALLLRYPQVNIIVADDGLQHHRLGRDLQIIVFDERGAGNGLRLPAGPLRERLPHQTAADTVVLYNAARASTPLPGWLATRRLAGVLPLADWWQGHAPPPDSWAALRDRPLTAAAAMASPERFFAMLRAQGLNLAHTHTLPDHDPLEPLPWTANSGDVIVTEKDAVKLPLERMPMGQGATRVWVVPLDFEPEISFAAALKRHFPKPPTARGTPDERPLNPP